MAPERKAHDALPAAAARRCDDMDCHGTSDDPCYLVRNWQVPRIGIIVEDLVNVLPEGREHRHRPRAPEEGNANRVDARVPPRGVQGNNRTRHRRPRNPTQPGGSMSATSISKAANDPAQLQAPDHRLGQQGSDLQRRAGRDRLRDQGAARHGSDDPAVLAGRRRHRSRLRDGAQLRARRPQGAGTTRTSSEDAAITSAIIAHWPPNVVSLQAGTRVIRGSSSSTSPTPSSPVSARQIARNSSSSWR